MRAISLVSRLPALAGALALFAYANIAHAATTGAGGDPLPWETPLARVLASFTGPVAKTLCILAIVLVGFGFAFSEGGGLRRLLGANGRRHHRHRRRANQSQRHREPEACRSAHSHTPV